MDATSLLLQRLTLWVMRTTRQDSAGVAWLHVAVYGLVCTLVVAINVPGAPQWLLAIAGLGILAGVFAACSWLFAALFGH